MTSASSRRSLFASAVALLIACAPAPQSELPRELVINNGTTLTITLVVNGTAVRTVSSKTQLAVPRSDLPPLPWSIETLTSGGHVLSTLTVRSGDVVESEHAMKGDAARADLSCGRLDVWAGPPVDGPSPGPGTPGDCDP